MNAAVLEAITFVPEVKPPTTDEIVAQRLLDLLGTEPVWGGRNLYFRDTAVRFGKMAGLEEPPEQLVYAYSELLATPPPRCHMPGSPANPTPAEEILGRMSDQPKFYLLLRLTPGLETPADTFSSRHPHIFTPERMEHEFLPIISAAEQIRERTETAYWEVPFKPSLKDDPFGLLVPQL